MLFSARDKEKKMEKNKFPIFSYSFDYYVEK